MLAVDPSRLHIDDLVESLGGPLFPFPCLQGKTRCQECRGTGPCAAERALSRACRAARAELSAVTLEDVANSLDDAVETPRRARTTQKAPKNGRRAVLGS